VHAILSLLAEPVTEIAGGPDLFINKDSTINLTCYVRHAPEPPSTIIWSHNHQVSRSYEPRMRFLPFVENHSAMKNNFNQNPSEFMIDADLVLRADCRYRYKQKHFSCSSRVLRKKLAAVFYRLSAYIDYRWYRAFVPLGVQYL